MEYLRIYESKTGGYVDLHPLHGEDELPNNAEASRILADHSHRIQLLPLIHAKDKEERLKWLPDVFGNKNPDLRIDGIMIGDIKTPVKSEQIRKSVINGAICECARQKVSVAVINLIDNNYRLHDLKTGIVGALQPERNKSIRFVWIVTKQKNLFKIDRETVFDDSIYEVLETLKNRAGDYLVKSNRPSA